jgi:RNA polymerase sigma-70 factor (ECF subfamily)
LQPEQAPESSQDWQACVAAIDALPPALPRQAFVLRLRRIATQIARAWAYP